MVSLKLLVALAVAGAQVWATRFCQCENRSKGRIFAGIEAACGGLGHNWCPSSCSATPITIDPSEPSMPNVPISGTFNSLGLETNCAYCEYLPPGNEASQDGSLPNSDGNGFNTLSQWCLRQSGSRNGETIVAEGLYCYTFEEAAPCPWCSYCNGVDNDFSDNPASNSDPINSVSSPRAIVTVVDQALHPGPGAGMTCRPIFPQAAQYIASEVASVEGCVKENTGDDDDLAVTCYPVGNPVGTLSIENTFRTLCLQEGGKIFYWGFIPNKV